MTGRHRYVLTYTLDGVLSGNALAWDAVGTGWDVPIDDVRVHVSAPAELAQGRCSAGEPGSTESCDVERAEPGHLVARVDGLDPGEGVTVSGTTGAALDGAPALPGPPGPAPGEQARIDPVAGSTESMNSLVSVLISASSSGS